MMYKYLNLDDQATGAQNATTQKVDRYGVAVYVDSDPDWVGAAFVIDPADEQGLKTFREFAAKMAAHYKSLKDKL